MRIPGCVNVLWHKVTKYLPHIKAIAEDPDKPERSWMTATTVASRVSFQLEDPAQALRMVLEGGGG